MHLFLYRYTSAAQDLVMSARGKLKERNWRTSDDKHATIDDISVFVIPLKPYKEEFHEWTVHQKTTLASRSSSDNITKEPNLIQTLENEQETPIMSVSNNHNSFKEEPPVSSSQVGEEGNAPEKDFSEIEPHEDYFKDEA